MATNAVLHEPVVGISNNQLTHSTNAKREDETEEKVKQITATSQPSPAAALPSEVGASIKQQDAATTSDENKDKNIRYRKKRRVTNKLIVGMANRQEEEVIDLCDNSSDEDESMTISVYNDLPDFWLENVFPFCGPLCYRFVASVNRQFRRVYLEYLQRVRRQLERELGRAESWSRRSQRLANILTGEGYPTSRQLTCSSISTTRFYLNDVVEFSTEPPVMISAAEAGSVAVLRYLEQQGYSHNVYTRNAAAAMGNIAALDFLYHPTENRRYLRHPRQYYEGLDLETTCRFAAECGQLAVVRYLHEECGCELRFDAANAAAACGQLHVLEYFHHEHGDIDISAARCAIVNGNYDVLRFLFLRSRMHGVDDDLCRIAADCGNLDMLMLLERCAFVMDESVCQAAAWRCYDHILEWIDRNGLCRCRGRYHHNEGNGT